EIDLHYERQMHGQVTNGRDGKGMIFVKAAGTNYLKREDISFDPFNTTPWTIVVGSVNALGQKTSFSTPGAALWVSAPGGEAGYQSEMPRVGGEWAKVDFTPGM